MLRLRHHRRPAGGRHGGCTANRGGRRECRFRGGCTLASTWSSQGRIAQTASNRSYDLGCRSYEDTPEWAQVLSQSILDEEAWLPGAEAGSGLVKGWDSA